MNPDSLLFDHGATPLMDLPDELVSFVAPSSVEAERYRSLRHALQRFHQESGFQVFGVTSAGAGDGKTLTTLNLAGALAQAGGTRVLVISADLRSGALPHYLGISASSPGLGELLLDDRRTLAQTALRLDSLRISVLQSGDTRVPPYELLASPRLKTIFDQARQSFDYVLVDTPPVVPVADCRLVAQVVDGFIFVVRAHKTPRKLFVEALRNLDPAPLLGVVFNGDDSPLSPYYRYYGQSRYRTKPPSVA